MEDPKIPTKKMNIKKRFGEKPRTIFRDSLARKNVKLISWPDRVKWRNIMYDYVKATWSEEGLDHLKGNDKNKIIKNLLSGKAMPLGLEPGIFVFFIGGINRIDTHQIVRTRVGAGYSQQCTGDNDMRHANILVPRSISSNGFKVEKFIDVNLQAKSLYADLIDTKEISLQDARYVLPHSLETFIYAHYNFNILLDLIRKRSCTMSQTWEFNEIVRQMKVEILKKFPEFKDFIKSPCESGRCFFRKSVDAGSTNLYLPDDIHNNFKWNANNFFYKKTRSEMVKLKAKTMKPRYFIGVEEVTKDEFYY